jgi:hypothetical protein
MEDLVENNKDKLIKLLKDNFKKTGREEDFELDEEIRKIYEMSDEKFEEIFMKKKTDK